MLFDGDSAAIVRTIVALGKALNLGLYAEGVEDEGAAVALSRLRCEFAQGYLFAKPLPLEKADALIEEMLLTPAEPRSR
jgi:EAL domain-containing protein (putative c-di-GMP-specific phosphodiesterase class I)